MTHIRTALALAGLAALALLTGCKKAERAAADDSTPPGEVRLPPGSPKLTNITVDTVRVRRERVVAVLPAQLALNEDHTVRVTSPVVGRIRALDAQPGDRVAAGQALAHIVSSDIAQAQSDLQKAEAALTQAGSALARARDLFAHQVIAQRDLQQAVNDSAQARAERDRALARIQLLGAAGNNVGQEYVLRAPLHGEVVDRSANPGQEVRPDLPQPLFTVANLDTLWLTANVYERDLSSVRRGERLIFTSDALPGRRITLTASYVSDVLDPTTRTATLRALVPNRDGSLRPATYGEVKVLAPDSQGVPVVPTVALVTRGEQTIVFVQQGPGRFVARPVQVADDDGETAVIVSGLRPGELVVTRGSLLLSAEARPPQ